jgi:excisionase family DNA binding protein
MASTTERSAYTERLAYSLDQARFRLGDVSRDTLERLIARGELRSFTVGRRRFISAAELDDFIRRREEAGSEP